METLLGIIMIYSVIHFFFIQYHAKHTDRSDYEKGISWVAIISIILIFIGLAE